MKIKNNHFDVLIIGGGVKRTKCSLLVSNVMT